MRAAESRAGTRSARMGGGRAGYAPRLRALAYAADLAAMREAGERVGLLVLAVHCWESARHWQGRDGVVVLAVPPDLDVDVADFSPVAGLDVLVVGDDTEAFYASVIRADENSAASVWIDEGATVRCVAPFLHAELVAGLGPVDCVRIGWCAVRVLHAHPQTYAVPIKKFGAALAAHRDFSMLSRAGVYAHAVFDEAVQALQLDLTARVTAPDRMAA